MVIDDNWMSEGACVGLDQPDVLFFPAKVSGRKTDYTEAKKICVTCPVRIHCLSYAIAHGITEGLWGGLTERERQRLPIERRRKIKVKWFEIYPHVNRRAPYRSR